MKLLIVLCVAASVFLVTTIILPLLYRERLQIGDRLTILKTQDTVGEHNTRAVDSKKKAPRRHRTRATTTRKMLRRLENEMYDIGIQLPVANFLWMWAGVAIGIPLLLLATGSGFLVPCMIALSCSIGPMAYASVRRSNRRARLEAQLTEAITMLCNALRAGHSFQSSMNTISSEMEGPIAEEFGRVFRETLRGMALDESLRRMVERVGSKDLEILTTAIVIQREIGGNLTEILENISGTIQARIDMKGEIKTRTSAGRVSGYIIGALPVFILIAMSVVSPEYCAPLFSNELGLMMLGVGVVMEIIGFIVIQKITDIKY